MKRFVLYLIISLFSLSVVAADYYTITADILNVRNAPSKNSDVVGVVRKGDVVEVHSGGTEGWMRISTSSLSGYVSSKYLKFSHSKDTATEQSKDKKLNLNFKKITGKILGWLIPILLIILSFSIDEEKVYDVFEDGTMVKRPSGGCSLFFIGFIWLIIKIYNLF